MYRCVWCAYTCDDEATMRRHILTVHRGVAIRTSYRRDRDGTTQEAQDTGDHDTGTQVSDHQRRKRTHRAQGARPRRKKA